jgi:molecular chaperone GrpE
MTDERVTEEQEEAPERADAAEEPVEERLAAGEAPAQPPVGDRGPVEGERASREVPPPEADRLRAERDEYLNDLRRVAADFDNFRKRAARERDELFSRANERLMKELLPVLDDLSRALEAAEQHEEAKLEEGVRLVHRQLAQLLEKEGLAEIDTGGKFDPHVHEALLSQRSDAEEGSVIEVLQKGYRLGDRVLRPARVVVAAPKEADDGDGD